MNQHCQTARFRDQLDQLTPDQIRLLSAFLEGLLARTGSTAGS